VELKERVEGGCKDQMVQMISVAMWRRSVGLQRARRRFGLSPQN
jgi:hypothetical protein